MTERMKWFDRAFSLNIPDWMYANVLERLRGTPARLEDRMKEVSKELLIRRYNDGWSIQENAGHLLDLEPLWAGRLDDFIAGEEKLRPADLTNRKTHEADHNLSPVEAILRQFREARFEFAGRLENLDEDARLRSCLHPRLNAPMRVIDMMFFIAEHDDHHLARISELYRILSAESERAVDIRKSSFK
ncbi:MAG: DinB family protein [Blastocatellia bacterium]|nr:DinB family protein [Blastocatellia bacterium]